jgi:drug/metabolite transporter (DMT)-like permease
MEWFIYALLAPILWSGCNIMDKFLLKEHIKNPISYQVLISLFDIISLIILLVLFPISINVYGFILGIASGIISLIAITFYNKSMFEEEASRVVPLMYLDSIFVVILAYIFLGEIFNFQKYVGIIFIVMGSILVSFKKIKKWHFSSTTKFILFSAILLGINGVITKYTLGFIDYFSFLVSQLLGYITFGSFFLLSSTIRKNFLNDIKKFNKKVFSLMSINAIIALMANVLFLLATSISDVSLVYAVISTQPFFIFIYTIIITKLAPNIIKENIDKSTILLKIIAICLIFLGTFFIGS